jgi:uncharacterized protein
LPRTAPRGRNRPRSWWRAAAAGLSLVAASALVVALSACSSSTVSAPSSAPLPGSSSADVAGLCAGETTAGPIARCLRDALGQFWSGELNQTVNEPVYLRARAAQVPPACRPGLTATPAFTCRSNLSLYLNPALLDTINKFIPRDQLLYALASVQAHEIGHVLQYRLHQPQIEASSPTAAQTRFIEQQADCLSGVWARHAARAGGLVAADFERVATKLVRLVSSNVEIQTHGTPQQRKSAIDRGLATGRPQSCRLVTFS